MSLLQAPVQGQVFNSSAKFCREHLSPASLYTLLHEQSHRLFPDGSFADLFAEIGRWSVPPRIVAVVMVLQRLEGLSDRGNLFAERLMTVARTARKQKRNVLEFLTAC